MTGPNAATTPRGTLDVADSSAGAAANATADDVSHAASEEESSAMQVAQVVEKDTAALVQQPDAAAAASVHPAQASTADVDGQSPAATLSHSTAALAPDVNDPVTAAAHEAAADSPPASSLDHPLDPSIPLPASAVTAAASLDQAPAALAADQTDGQDAVSPAMQHYADGAAAIKLDGSGD